MSVVEQRAFSDEDGKLYAEIVNEEQEKAKRRMEVAMPQIMSMIQATVQKKNDGKELARAERILLSVTAPLTGASPDRIPTATFFTDSAADYYGFTGKVGSLRQLDVDPDLHADILVRYLEEFPFDFYSEGIDTMNYELEAMNLVKLRHPENIIADISVRYFNGEQDIPKVEEAVERFDPKTDGRLPLRLELYRKFVKLCHDRGIPVIAAPSAHFAWLVNLIGYKRAIQWMETRPQLIHRLMRALTKAEIKWYNALAETGVDGFINIDAWNSCPNFKPWQLLTFEKPYIKPIILAAAPRPVIHFYWGLRYCGDPGWIKFLEASAETGTFCLTNLDPDAVVPPSSNLRRFKETAIKLQKAYIVGLKDEYLFSRPVEHVKKRVLETIKELYPCEKGCFIVPNRVPTGNPEETAKLTRGFLEALHEYGTYPINLDKLTKAENTLAEVKDTYVEDIKARLERGYIF